MSKTLAVTFGDEFFWAYDVALGVFLKHLIDAAEPHAVHFHREWLPEAISDWRLAAVVGDCFGLTIEESWSPVQREFFITLEEDTCCGLARRDSIRADEA
ncbi:MAG: hypothetical protein K8R36_20735 [Planctomycetales bacterium]|nr:hypothetical protein [Planctomycetales bacterium]